MKASRYIIPIAIIAVVVVICAFCISTNNNNSNEVSNNMDISMDVTADGDKKALAIEGGGNYFSPIISASDILVYYIPLENYFGENGMIDYESYYNDMEKNGVFDDNLGEKIPSFTKKITDFKVSYINGKNIKIEFSADGNNACYIAYIKSTGLNGIKDIAVNTVYAPDEKFIDTTPVLSVTSTIYENTDDPVIIATVTNTKFSKDIDVSDVSLSGAIANCEVDTVTVVNDNELHIKVSGTVEISISDYAYVKLSADATECDKEMSASFNIIETFMTVDFESVKLSDGILTLDVLVPEIICEICDEITFEDVEFPITDVKDSDIDGYKVLTVQLEVTEEDIDKCLEELSELEIFAGVTDSTLSFEYDTDIFRAGATATVDSYNILDDGTLEAYISIIVFNGTIEDLDVSDLELICNYSDAEMTLTDNGLIKVTIPDYEDDSFTVSIVVKEGVTNLWGTDAGEFCITAAGVTNDVTNGDGELTTDEMIKKIFESTKPSIFSGLELIGGGAEAVVTVLGMCGVIDTRSETEIMLEDIKTDTTQIKDMLNAQKEMLNEINNKLNTIQETLKDVQIDQFSNNYKQLVDAHNALNSAILNLSLAIHTKIMDLVIDNEHTNMYVYITNEGKITITGGSLFEDRHDLATIDGKVIAQTIEVPLKSGDTRTFSNTAAKYASYDSGIITSMISDIASVLREKYTPTYGETFSININGEDKSWTYEQLATKVCDGITMTLTRDIVKVGGSDNFATKVVENYTKYLNKMASLNESGMIDPTAVNSNAVTSRQNIMKLAYSFETEIKDTLIKMEQELVLTLMKYTPMVRNILFLQGVTEDGASMKDVNTRYETTINFLKTNRGYHADSDMSTCNYCYVTNSWIGSRDIIITGNGTFSSGNQFESNLTDSANVNPLQSRSALNISDTLCNYDNINQILERYKKNYNDPQGSGFWNYIKNNCRYEGNNKYLITSFDNGAVFKPSENVELYSDYTPMAHPNLVVPGKSYTLQNVIDQKGCCKAKFNDENIQQYAYKGTLYDLSSLSKVKVKSNDENNYIFAVAYYNETCWCWRYDEAAVLTHQNAIDNVTESHNYYIFTDDDHNSTCCVSIHAYYVIFNTWT